MKPQDFEELFDRLDIESASTAFLQSSAQWLGLDVAGSIDLIEALLRRLGPRGTLFMPSYAFAKPQPSLPVGTIFDVKATPSQVGLISELFRRRQQVSRSESWWVPVCGIGPLARECLEGQIDVVHPFAPDSTFVRIVERDAKLIGLGVTLNTSSLQHYPDALLESQYPRSVFLPTPVAGKVRDHTGVVHETKSIICDNALRRSYAAWNLTEQSPLLRAARRRFDDGATFRFSYPLGLYFREAMRVGRERLANGLLPPWFKDGWSTVRDA